MKNNRVAIFIDGGNLYHLVLKKMGISELAFDFDGFVSFLIKDMHIPKGCKHFYIGTIREKEGDLRSKHLMSQQTKLFAKLKKDEWILGTSKLKTRIETITVDNRMRDYQKLQKIGITEILYERKREKGIDVMLATDLIVGAVEDLYDRAIIVSSDADLLPAIKWVRSVKKKHIEYIGFSIEDKNDFKNNTKPLLSMIPNTDTQRVIAQIDLLQFQSKTLKFKAELAELILNNEKNVTWRLFDDKNLEIGSLLNLEISETGKSFAKAKIVDVKEKKLKEIDEFDYVGHEKFESLEVMLNKYKEYYGEKVNLDTLVKIIRFEIKK